MIWNFSRCSYHPCLSHPCCFALSKGVVGTVQGRQGMSQPAPGFRPFLNGPTYIDTQVQGNSEVALLTRCPEESQTLQGDLTARRLKKETESQSSSLGSGMTSPNPRC